MVVAPKCVVPKLVSPREAPCPLTKLLKKELLIVKRNREKTLKGKTANVQSNGISYMADVLRLLSELEDAPDKLFHIRIGRLPPAHRLLNLLSVSGRYKLLQEDHGDLEEYVEVPL